MTTITIRNVDDELKERLKVRASEHGRSMEAEARAILREVLDRANKPEPGDLYRAVRGIVEPLGGIDLDLPARKPIRDRKLFD